MLPAADGSRLLMALDPRLRAEFKAELHRAKLADPDAWEATTKLVGGAAMAATVARLVGVIGSSELAPALKEALLAALSEVGPRHGGAPAIRFKELTGLSTAKALRALCVRFGVTGVQSAGAPDSSWDPHVVEAFIRSHRNPFDLLSEIDVRSVIDLGAGDLSFAVELVDRYLPALRSKGKDLVVHCLDRLQPGSQLGGRLHAAPGAVDKLRAAESAEPGLVFRFWGNADMFAMDRIKGLWSRYSIVTCHAPPTPTFAYEPARLSAAMIHDELKRTKGAFHHVKLGGEEALEVLHGEKRLLFPPWKFDVVGPAALLSLVAERGKLVVLSSVDSEVFWEILSQLLEGEEYRPKNVIYTPSAVAGVFGNVYHRLRALPIGGSLVLSDAAPLRAVLPQHGRPIPIGTRYRFRYVEVRRGAVFDGIPSSQTARLFCHMTEEEPPWFLVLVPEPIPS
jgi:hypothetical protein